MKTKISAILNACIRSGVGSICVLVLNQPCLAFAGRHSEALRQEFGLEASPPDSWQAMTCSNGEDLLQVASAELKPKPVDDAAFLRHMPGAAAEPSRHAASTDDVSRKYAENGGRSAGADGRSKREWAWRRASLAELAGITVVVAGTLYSEAEYGKPKRPSWTARNRFDEGLRNALRLRSSSAREVAGSVGDGVMAFMIAVPALDSFYTLGYRDRNWDALWQTTVINAESFAFTAFIASVVENATKRQRPFLRDCQGRECEAQLPNRGFPSGHVAFALTGAGLYCTHHQYQSLYDPATERALCGASLGLAAVGGVLRVMSDSHYATDVIAGSALGLFSGFLLPRLLHYYWSEPKPSPAKTGSGNSFIKHVSLTPQLLSGGGSLNFDVKF